MTTVQLLTRIPGRQAFGVPAFGGPATVTPPGFACTSYMPHPAGQGDITWKGNLFGFTAPGGSGAQVQRIAVTVTHNVSDVAAFSAATAQVMAGSTPVGPAAPLTLSATPAQDTFTVTTGYAASQLPNLAVQVNWHAVAPGLAYVTSAYASASYSYPNSITGFTIDPAAVMATPRPSIVNPRAFLVAAGPASFSLAPQFGQPTTGGDLLVAWVSSNSSSATFDTAVTGTGWLLGAHAGAAFGWVSLWYRPDCGHAEAPPTFTSTGGQATSPLSQLMEFGGARYLDQAGGITGTTSLSLTPGTADTASDDLVVAFATWGTTGSGPAAITMAGADSSGAALPLQLASNATSAGNQFWVTGWAQASAPFGPGADTVTATIGMFGGGGGITASFKPLNTGTVPPQMSRPVVNRSITIPIRAGR